MPVGLRVELRDIGGVKSKLLKLAAINPKESLPVIGETIVDHVREGFDKEQDPYGSPWKPLAASTLAARRGNGGARILRDTNRLYNSINSQVRGDGVAIGTNVTGGKKVEYGAAHQFGLGGIPARPFLPWKSPTAPPELPSDWLDDVTSILEKLFDV